MKLGLVTSILEHMDFEEMIDFASANQLDCVEVACWPKSENERRYAGVSHIDVRTLDAHKAEEILDYAQKRNVEISALAYYPNPMNEDLNKRSAVIEHLGFVIKAANLLNVPYVTTFIGRDQHKTLSENLDLLEEIWQPIIQLAESNNVKIAIENCPMFFTEDEWPNGQNIMTSPSNWAKVFERLDSDALGINFDPSHCIWQQLDYIQPLYDYKEKIFFVHFKDIKLYRDKLSKVGVLATPLEYMVPKLPGYGDVDWYKFISALSDIGYDGYTSIEIEDKTFEASVEEIEASIVRTIEYMGRITY